MGLTQEQFAREVAVTFRTAGLWENRLSSNQRLSKSEGQNSNVGADMRKMSRLSAFASSFPCA
jgi:hypothetical protein